MKEEEAGGAIEEGHIDKIDQFIDDRKVWLNPPSFSSAPLPPPHTHTHTYILYILHFAFTKNNHQILRIRLITVWMNLGIKKKRMQKGTDSLV